MSNIMDFWRNEWKKVTDNSEAVEMIDINVKGNVNSIWKYSKIKTNFIAGKSVLNKEYKAGKNGTTQKQRWKDLIDNKANTCAIKLSYALNNAGYIIPEHKLKSGKTTWTSNINPKHEYILSADDMGDYLERTLGEATIRSGGAINSDKDLEDFIDAMTSEWKNYKGILYLDSQSWAGYVASGHVDLLYEDYGNDPYIVGSKEELDDYIDWRNNDGWGNTDAQLDVYIWLLEGEKRK